ncbi:uncharacterized protein NEMAJ01_0108 [Nematocida major]|uniref:uncharacterized protein n=1 Tax=Nematocida major TaxID=1912982 RepID=UPI0020075DD4|nr:uncharacterized protein NEMAJ01_0108 [Nematocida major]KAH9385212.1 hypothetical protein NEMAJ01_0108 [Nematocida major]
MEAYLSDIEVRKVEDTPEMLSYRINNIDPSVLNAIRRTIISDTPTVAIHWVCIKENETVMADEILAHRIGLIPVTASPHILKPVEKKEDFSPISDLTTEDSICMDLVVSNTTNKILPVYSDSIKVQGAANVSVKKRVLITRLAPNKKIECKLFAILGTGREHSKWMPTSACYYRCIKKIHVKDASKAHEMKKYFRDGFLLGEDGPKIDEDRVLVNTDVQKKYPDAISISTQENSFLFEIETITESPVDIIARGLGVLQSKLKALQAAAQPQ